MVISVSGFSIFTWKRFGTLAYSCIKKTDRLNLFLKKSQTILTLPVRYLSPVKEALFYFFLLTKKKIAYSVESNEIR